MRIPQPLYLDLLTVPYLRNGRTMEGLDCVGVFLEVQRRLGRTLPFYASDPSILDDSLTTWKRVEVPEPGDGILLYSSDPPFHLATVIGQNLMIHATESAGVVVEPFDTPLHRRRIEGIYRWHQKASGQSA